jgi:hypothetical protein
VGAAQNLLALNTTPQVMAAINHARAINGQKPLSFKQISQQALNGSVEVGRRPTPQRFPGVGQDADCGADMDDAPADQLHGTLGGPVGAAGTAGSQLDPVAAGGSVSITIISPTEFLATDFILPDSIASLWMVLSAKHGMCEMVVGPTPGELFSSHAYVRCRLGSQAPIPAAVPLVLTMQRVGAGSALPLHAFKGLYRPCGYQG